MASRRLLLLSERTIDQVRSISVLLGASVCSIAFRASAVGIVVWEMGEEMARVEERGKEKATACYKVLWIRESLAGGRAWTNERGDIWLRCRDSSVRRQRMMTARPVNEPSQSQWRTMGQAGGMRHAVHLSGTGAHAQRGRAGAPDCKSSASPSGTQWKWAERAAGERTQRRLAGSWVCKWAS